MPFEPMPIATRTSPLALAQAYNLQAILGQAAGVEDHAAAFPILGLSTTGDRITDRALLAAGEKACSPRSWRPPCWPVKRASPCTP